MVGHCGQRIADCEPENVEINNSKSAVPILGLTDGLTNLLS